MMYSVVEIEREIEEYFGKDNQDVITKTKHVVSNILNEQDIVFACEMIKNSLVEISNNGKLIYPDKKFLPTWIRKVVFMVIYQYLLAGNAKYNQSELLKQMGLYPDIFGKKHWNMYSPDMKVRQRVYDNLKLPFNHAEIESNEIFRAMIHHMISYSTVLTDTFVDMFGKMGIVPALCANGYKYTQSWVGEGNYKILTIFRTALKKKMKVCKRIADIQYKIKHSDNEAETVMRYYGIAVMCSDEIKKLDNVIDIIEGKKKLPVDIYTYAACFIVQQYFVPEYWIDGNLRVIEVRNEKTKKREKKISAELQYNLSKSRIRNFCDIDVTEIVPKISDLYYLKRFAFKNIEAKAFISDFYYIQKDETNLLYIDIPKYLREQERFKFELAYYLNLCEILLEYQGDWILTWKNYVELLPKSSKNDTYTGLYTEGKILAMEEFGDGQSIGKYTNYVKDIYEALLDINNRSRELYVFRYRDKNRNRNHPNSIIFITTIDFKQPDNNQFSQQYKLIFKNEGVLEKLTYKDFYKTTIKYMDGLIRSNTIQEKK